MLAAKLTRAASSHPLLLLLLLPLAFFIGVGGRQLIPPIQLLLRLGLPDPSCRRCQRHCCCCHTCGTAANR
jgi:hypothetical protein